MLKFKSKFKGNSVKVYGPKVDWHHLSIHLIDESSHRQVPLQDQIVMATLFWRVWTGGALH